MDTDDQRRPRVHVRVQLREDPALQRVGEVGEDQVPAQHQIEGARRQRSAHVAFDEGDAPAELRAQAPFVVGTLECATAPGLGQILEAARVEAAAARPLEHHRVRVDARHAQGEAIAFTRAAELPEKLDRVGFLARGTAEAEAGKRVRAARVRRARERRDHDRAERVEHAAVAVETRDGDAAGAVEKAPLVGVAREDLAIGRGVRQSELAKPPPDAPADLPAHLSKAGPAHVEPRQRPLQKCHALGVGHGACTRPPGAARRGHVGHGTVARASVGMASDG